MVANKRGEVILKLQETEYKLVPSYENMMAIEDRFDLGVGELSEHLSSIKKTSDYVEYVHKFVAACGHNVTLEQFKKQLGTVPLKEIINATNRFLILFMNGADENGKK